MIWGKVQPENWDGYWFAWYPVQLLDGRYVWLETVWRSEGGDSSGGWWWNYRLRKQTNGETEQESET